MMLDVQFCHLHSARQAVGKTACKYWLSQAVSRLDNNKTLTFGDVQVTTTDIQSGNESIFWCQRRSLWSFYNNSWRYSHMLFTLNVVGQHNVKRDVARTTLTRYQVAIAQEDRSST